MTAHLSVPLTRLSSDPSMPESEKNKIAIGASGLILGLILTLAGFIYYKTKSRGLIALSQFGHGLLLSVQTTCRLSIKLLSVSFRYSVNWNFAAACFGDLDIKKITTHHAVTSFNKRLLMIGAEMWKCHS